MWEKGLVSCVCMTTNAECDGKIINSLSDRLRFRFYFYFCFCFWSWNEMLFYSILFTLKYYSIVYKNDPHTSCRSLNYLWANAISALTKFSFNKPMGGPRRSLGESHEAGTDGSKSIITLNRVKFHKECRRKECVSQSNFKNWSADHSRTHFLF